MKKKTGKDWEVYVEQCFGISPDYPWGNYPENAVFRHPENKKWFALFMEVSGEKLGLPEKTILPIVNLKCDPVWIGSLLMEPGIFPAYHMNKEKWISVALDGRGKEEKIKELLEMSFSLTAGKGKIPPMFTR